MSGGGLDGDLLRDERRFLERARSALLAGPADWLGGPGGPSRGADGRAVLPALALPRLRFAEGPNSPDQQGAASGEQAEGTGSPAGSGGGPGDGAATHGLDLTRAELAALLGEELELPRIEPREQHAATADGRRWTGRSERGPSGLRDVRRTCRRAMRRAAAAGGDPAVVHAEDQVFRAERPARTRRSAAAVFLVMDVSGSMGREQKELVRQQAFWIDAWLRSQYAHVEVVHIVHDAAAHVVDEDTFFRIREAGGTRISSAYELMLERIRRDFPPERWSLYGFQFSDGDNWSLRDTRHCLSLLEEELLPLLNQFAYGQVRSEWGSGQFGHELRAALGEHEGLAIAAIEGVEDLGPALHAFLGRGR